MVLSTQTDDDRSLGAVLKERLVASREPATVVVAMAGLLVVAGAFVYGPFPSLYQSFWDGACTTADSFLFCSSMLQNGFTAGLLIGIAAPLVGAYLVNRQMALVGEALAHTAFGGVAIGLFIGATITSIEIAGVTLPLDFPLVWALVVAIVAALGLQYLAVTTDEYADVPLAVVLTGGFAVGIAVVSYGDGVVFGREIEGYLFGNILFVPFENVQLMVGLALLTLGLVGLTHKQLLMITFDREAARLARMHVRFYDTILIVVTALVVVAAMQILGAILVAALLVVPVAAAMQLTTSFNRGLILSVVIGEFAVVAGLLLSYRWDIATGPMIVLVAIAVYLWAIVAGKLS